MPPKPVIKNEEVGFFRGGNKAKGFQVKPEHMKRIAKIFSDSEDENEEEKASFSGFDKPLVATATARNSANFNRPSNIP